MEQTYIFMGRSGCGKGTQAKLVAEALKTKTPNTPILYVETGSLLREFISNNSNLTQEYSKELMATGSLFPEFMAINMWSNFFIKNFKGGQHIIMDGVARKINEIYALESAMKFYKRNTVTVVIIDVSKKWSTDRLLARKRNDDTKEDIENRLKWFETDVIPSIKYFEQDPYFNVVKINGEQTIEQVHNDLMKALKI